MYKCSQTHCSKCDVRDLGICGMVTVATQERLGKFGRLQSYAAQKVVWSEDTEPAFTGLLVSGYLRLQRYGADGRRQILCLLTPGDIVGGSKKRGSSYSLEASTDALVCSFDTAGFERLEAENADLRRAVYALHSRKLDQLRWLTWSLGALSAEERLCAFLAVATKYMPCQALANGGVLLTIDLPRVDIADLLGTSVESISRITNRLAGNGIIGIRNSREFEIPSLERLVAMGCLQGSFGSIRFPTEFTGLARTSLQPPCVSDLMSGPQEQPEGYFKVLPVRNGVGSARPASLGLDRRQ